VTVFQTSAVLLTFAAAGAYVNLRWMRLPATIGYMGFALLASFLAFALAALGWVDLGIIRAFVAQIDFSKVLLHGMLSFLLFAGALHVDMADLKTVGWPVGILATVGVAIATWVIGTLVFYAAQMCGLRLPYIYALLFGALIAPTDPIAVLAMLKEAGMSKSLYAKVAGESLFNDGVGVVAFMTILGIASGGAADASGVAAMLAREGIGGLVLGGVMGWAVCGLMQSVDDYKVEVLLTLALASGGYALAEAVHVSAPIAMVAAGLMVGNTGRRIGMSDRTRKRLDAFWELIDETLNAVLFMLVGLHVVIVAVDFPRIALGVCAVIATLAGRLVSVALPVSVMRLWTPFERGAIPVLTWGGLRGGLSVAMALSLPEGPEKGIILPATYIVVLFSILVQGLTFPRVLAFLTRKS
jgi:CPA1 family monovalent cation:H+ antiporter